jgi:hypothetical protein
MQSRMHGRLLDGDRHDPPHHRGSLWYARDWALPGGHRDVVLPAMPEVPAVVMRLGLRRASRRPAHPGRRGSAPRHACAAAHGMRPASARGTAA